MVEKLVSHIVYRAFDILPKGEEGVAVSLIETSCDLPKFNKGTPPRLEKMRT
jgi:hypothetical protein